MSGLGLAEVDFLFLRVGALVASTDLSREFAAYFVSGFGLTERELAPFLVSGLGLTEREFFLLFFYR